jgi:2-polyprenyl-3-methyl-5-hydroxy-6-metoxy-1,4-benzoquinol methylase
LVTSLLTTLKQGLAKGWARCFTPAPIGVDVRVRCEDAGRGCSAHTAVQPEPMIRSFIYDTLILRLTSRWYAEVLRRVPESAALLDVGIGTAGALLANADVVKRKGLRVTGIDIDADYVDRARQRLRNSTLTDSAEVRFESVSDHQGGPYDAVYFSGSFMLLPEPEQALRHCGALLNPGGRIFFTQTFQKQPARWMEVLKPLLKRVTSIDFGRVTYEDNFRAQIRAAGLELEEFTTLAHHGSRASCIAVARPGGTRPEQEETRS